MQLHLIVLVGEIADDVTLIIGSACTIYRGRIPIATYARDVNGAGNLLRNGRIHLVFECYHTQADLVQDRLWLRQIKVLGRVPLHAGFELRVIALDIFQKSRDVAVLEDLLSEEQLVLVLKDEESVGDLAIDGFEEEDPELLESRHT